MLEKIKPIAIPEGMKRIHFAFPSAPRSGRVVLRIRELSKAYGEKQVIGTFSLEVERGQKLALVGPNGAGKSTLMRIVAGAETSFEGELTFGANILVGYFSQESAELMASDSTVEEEAESVCPFEMLPKLRNLLGAFLFRDDDIEKPISVLSGGERSRLALLKLLLKPSNLLVLDEPTNHLDLTSKDILLEALKKYEGTVIFVSHDRQFLDELADRVLELTCGRSPCLYHGNYAYYLEKKAQESQENTLDQTANQNQGSVRKSDLSSPISSQKWASVRANDWGEEKARRARLRKLKRREEEIAARIESIAAEKVHLQHELELPNVYTDGAKTKRILAAMEDLDREAEKLNQEWLEIAEILTEEDA